MTTIKISDTKEIRIHEQGGSFQGFYGQVHKSDYTDEFQILKTSPWYTTKRGIDNWVNKLRQRKEGTGLQSQEHT